MQLASPLFCVCLQLPHDIRALAAKGNLTFAATGSSIVECRRIAR